MEKYARTIQNKFSEKGLMVSAVSCSVGGLKQSEVAGAMCKIPESALAELKSNFDVSGGTVFYENIENYSEQKARELGLKFDNSNECGYFRHVYKTNNGQHDNKE